MKAYVKPQLHVEYFTLSQNIAYSCSVPGGGTTLGRPNSGDPANCGWAVGDIVLWQDGGGCTEYLAPGQTIKDIGGIAICYNNPSSGYSIFGS